MIIFPLAKHSKRGHIVPRKSEGVGHDDHSIGSRGRDRWYLVLVCIARGLIDGVDRDASVGVLRDGYPVISGGLSDVDSIAV